MQGRKLQVFIQVWNPVYYSIWEQIEDKVWEYIQTNVGWKIRTRVWDRFETIPIESITQIGNVKENS